MAPPILTENQFTHSGDKTTFYWSAGPSGGPLVIFIHGWPANGETWKPQLLALASLGFRVIAPDTRGYGRSSVPKGRSAYTLEHHVSDMLALLAHLGRDKAIWIGHDWGAGLVWAFASQQPEKCVGVCCMAVPYIAIDLENLVSLSNRELYPEDKYPLAQWDYQAFHNEQPETSAAQLQANVPNTIKMLYQGGSSESYGKPAFTSSVRKLGGWFGGAPAAPDLPFETTLLKNDKPAFDRMVAEFERNGFEGPNDYYRNSEANKAYSEKAPNGGRLRYPVLFIEARWDGVCDTALSRLSEPMRELCEDLTEVSIEAGHWVALEKPEETNAAIVRWIATKLPTYFPGYWKTPFVSRV
ncbi:bifunctional epoxide hydrolase 2 [Colletotrichum liriopes]|uniref:Bifunctional epoxide hydrolase 2 n=1 Tax=Colletotrichum liriopes TaxID=708192 RepID=A0AA37GYE9_9PEZI|nr:bifunctional epoxide hydrolase 2 [Colletotrichum liriopes]